MTTLLRSLRIGLADRMPVLADRMPVGLSPLSACSASYGSPPAPPPLQMKTWRAGYIKEKEWHVVVKTGR